MADSIITASKISIRHDSLYINNNTQEFAP